MEYKSKSTLLEEELRKEGKVRDYNTPEDYKKSKEMDEQLLDFRRRSIIKQKNAEIDASQIILIH